LWCENVVSGIARDLLAEAMLRIEAAGYSIVMHTHDEVTAEVLEGFGSTEEFTQLMTRKPSWALELPIAASAWSGLRYCK
jgi:DNA polymerase